MDSGTFPRGSGLFVKKKVAIAGAPAGLLRGAAGALEAAGYSVVATERLEDLLSIPAEKVPDLVILDNGFPPDGGVAACRKLRERVHWRMVSMMLVVPAGEAHLEEALVPGVSDFLLAPFPPGELLDKTKRLTLIPARRELNTEARVRGGRDDGTLVLGKTLNVSGNGLLAEIEGAIEIGRIVEIEFFLPGDQAPLNAKCRIMRRTTEPDHFHPAYGLRFAEISEKDQVRIDAFVTERERAGFRR
jgi:CheY-like chemotaxis protein